MSLALATHPAEVLRHVSALGTGRKPLFPRATRRMLWLRQLGDSCERHRLRCVVWSLTDQRLHLVLAGAPASVTLATHELVSARLRQGHSLSTLVQRDVYLLEVVRHALLAPVRAGLAGSAADWPWSSAREALGLRPAPRWMDLGSVYALLGPRDGQGIERLRRFLDGR